MGNKPVRIGVKLDEEVYEAGSEMTGKVYLSINSKLDFPVQSVQLALIGEELAVIEHEETVQEQQYDAGHHRHNNFSRLTHSVERASSSLVRMDVPLATFGPKELSPGQYEYPFEWELPSNLPSTMRAHSGDSHCEIRYHIMAYIKTGNSSSWQNPTFSDQKVICIAAQPSATNVNTGLTLDPEEFRVHSCCFHQGNIYLGWDVDKTVASPGSNIDVGIQGGNRSKADVQCLRAIWSERVTWSAHGHSQEISRTLSKSEIPASMRVSAWQPLRGRRWLQADDSQTRLVAKLKLPSDARDTYDGRLIRVQHTLTITAVTPGLCFVTSPESSAQVHVQRKEALGAGVTTASPVPTAPSVYDAYTDTGVDEYEPTLVEANLLPSDWSPQQADVVVLPASSAVLLDSDPISSSTAASAPDESLVASQRAASHDGTALSRLQLTLSQASHTQDPVEILSALFGDPSMVACIQNLTPSEFVGTVKCSPKNLPSTARLLAGTMDRNFTCQHVLACLWGLPPDVRLEVLHQVAPLASDLDTQQAALEEQLDDTERLHFQAALK